MKHDWNTGEVLEWYQKPYNGVDRIAAQHDICDDMGKSRHECDKKMVRSLDKIP